ncbi:MAG: AhpC/TSA family protein [Tannerella sp.]|jgi:thiol-disulfide isomerase/thioredoxin|nr:AhpC/TSA family protein [Tannerella sp.]
MKKLIFIVFILSAILTGCSKKETVITGKLTGGEQLVAYSAPLDGMSYYYVRDYGFVDSIRTDADGNFELKPDVSRPVFITLWASHSNVEVKLLVEPGGHYDVQVGDDKKAQISGTNAAGQMLYAVLPNPAFVELEVRDLVWNDDVSLDMIHSRIDSMKQADMTMFGQLSDDGEISQSFSDLAMADRDCYYAAMKTRVLLVKTYNLIQNSDTSGYNRFIDALATVYKQYPPDGERLMFSSFWRQYVQLFATEYCIYSQKDMTPDRMREMRRDGTFRAYVLSSAKQQLTSKAFEFFQAGYLYFNTVEGDYSTDFITLFEQFEKDYPRSKYSKYLKPQIDKIVDYYRTVEQPYDETVRFLDNYAGINSLKEAVKPFAGKKIYVDVWASWCGPCKAEFAHNKALKTILAENDIRQLYISIDSDDRVQQWEEAIKYYSLSGNHIRANESFVVDLRRIFGREDGALSIPWYLYIDENGNIVSNSAQRPAEIVANGKFPDY